MVIQGEIDYLAPVVGSEARGVEKGDGPHSVPSPLEGIPELWDVVSHGAHDSQTRNDDPPFGFHGILIPVVGIDSPIHGLYFIGRTYNVQISSLKSTAFMPEIPCLASYFIIPGHEAPFTSDGTLVKPYSDLMVEIYAKFSKDPSEVITFCLKRTLA